MGLLPPLQALIRLRRTDPTLLAQDRAVLENFVMEERVHDARLVHFATTAGTTPWTSLSEFFDGHSHRYLHLTSHWRSRTLAFLTLLKAA